MRLLICFSVLLAAFGASLAKEPIAPRIPVPEGFELQILDPLDGQIARPKGWYYVSRGLPSGWEWLITEQDISKGPYETGMRIQIFLGPEKAGVGKLGLVERALADKKRAAVKVLNECAPHNLGDFTRACLEVLEDIPNAKTGKTGRYRVAYTFAAYKTMDMVSVMIFGAPPDKWAATEPIRAAMAMVILIGESSGSPAAATP